MRLIKLAVIAAELLYAASMASSSQACDYVQAAFVQSYYAVQPVAVQYQAFAVPQAYVVQQPVAAVQAYAAPLAVQAVAPVRQKVKIKTRGFGAAAFVAPPAFVQPFAVRPVQRIKQKIKTR